MRQNFLEPPPSMASFSAVQVNFRLNNWERFPPCHFPWWPWLPGVSHATRDQNLQRLSNVVAIKISNVILIIEHRNHGNWPSMMDIAWYGVRTGPLSLHPLTIHLGSHVTPSGENYLCYNYLSYNYLCYNYLSYNYLCYKPDSCSIWRKLSLFL